MSNLNALTFPRIKHTIVKPHLQTNLALTTDPGGQMYLHTQDYIYTM